MNESNESNEMPAQSQSFPPPAPPASPNMGGAMGPGYLQPRRSRGPWRKVLVTVLILSLLGNGYLLVLLSQFLSVGGFQQTVLQEGQRNQTVAVYEVLGGINGDSAEQLGAFVRNVRNDDNVRAVVIRVDSGGGSPSASDQMYTMLRELDQTKPVVISMGGVAASGGYYLAMGGREIFVEPITITGSIGVISMTPQVTGTMDLIGVEPHTIRATRCQEHKAKPWPFEEITQEDLDRTREVLDLIHVRFMEVVAEGRSGSLTAEQVEALSDGRVWVGQNAIDEHLVDQIGYLSDATSAAAGAAGLTEPQVVRYRQRPGLLAMVGIGGASETAAAVTRGVASEMTRPRIMLQWQPGL